ncbi:MAG TPA: hypothetical protein VJL80_15045 [Aeromicrobium sp.]|nr:hypothetical protein [Aeromicrobium sp.]HKY59352.1 hypothetical protein [Aeromicrobium sp.]
MRNKAIGTAVLALGALVAVLGLALMAILGPDGRFTSGPHAVDVDGVAVVTAPTVIAWKNVEVEILAEVPASKPVFVGVANSVDLQAYLKGVRRLEITSFDTPWKLRTRQAAGRDALPGAPTAVDWWRAHSAGLGGAAIKTRLPDETVSVAILSVGSTNLRGLKVTIAYGVQGAFLKGLGLLLGGGGLAWAGLLARRGERLWESDGEPADEEPWTGDESPTVVLPRQARVMRIPRSVADQTGPAEPGQDDGPDEEVHEVFVYVDEHGVEHEISAEEAAQYEVVHQVEEVIEHDVPEPEPEPEREPEPVAESEPRAEPATYFWVDENGVEHEVTEDELHEFELYDGDES